jgi:putative glycosyltransferase
MLLSIVATLYNTGPHLMGFYERITRCAQEITHDYELILVNDGSPDNSLELVVALREKDQRVKVIDLSRNFGHHKAIMTGLSYARSDYVFLIDSDLEEPPETLKLFWEEMQSSKDLDVVFGVQDKRKGGWFEKIAGSMFDGFITLRSEIKIPKNFLTVRLMTRRYTENLVRCQEREINFSTLAELTGFQKKAIVLEKESRSPTSYSLLKKFSILVNAITASTIRPLWLIFYLGLGITLISSVFILKLLIDRGVYGIGLEGWTSVIVSIFFFGGLIIFVLGIIGIYLSKIFIESKHRPYTVIRKLYGLNEGPL